MCIGHTLIVRYPSNLFLTLPRLGFCFMLFHTLLFLISMMSDNVARFINRNLWLGKLFVLLGLLYFSFTISPGFYDYFYMGSVFVSPFFIFSMFLVMVEVYYVWAKHWSVRFFDHGMKYFGFLLIASTVFNILWILYYTVQTYL